MNRTSKFKSHAAGGYTMVGFMFILTIGLILMAVAAPTVVKDIQREREEEMFWRGRQIANALARYGSLRGGNRFPTDLKELVTGVSVGVKKVRLLRPHALCDPMVPCEQGEVNWKTVHAGDPLIKELLNAYIASQQKNSMLPPPPAILVANARGVFAKLPGQEADVESSTTSSSNSSAFDTSMTPILGVVSAKSDAPMFRAYYGIEKYDSALFFAGVPVYAGGEGFGFSLDGGSQSIPVQGGGAPSSTSSRRCGEKGEGVLINGICYGTGIPKQ